jgi:hypothetical protein
MPMPPESEPARLTTNAQRGAVVAAVVLAVASVFISFGASIVAMLAIWIAWAVARRRGQSLTRGVAWVVGVGSVGAVLLSVFAVFVATQVPRSQLTNLKRAVDSAAAAPQKPPPEWLRKITPPNARQQSPITDSVVRSSAFTIWTMVMGVTFFAGIFGAYAGTLGWLVIMLLAYGATGSWLARGVTDPSLLTAPPLR